MKAEHDKTKEMPVYLIISKFLAQMHWKNYTDNISKLDRCVFSKVLEVKEHFDGNQFNVHAFSEDGP